MKESIKLCTKDVNFSFNGTTYEQKDSSNGFTVRTSLSRYLHGRIRKKPLFQN